MNLRIVLFLSLLLSTATLWAQPASPVGLQLYSFRDAFKKDVPGTLAKVKAMGFREVETAGNYGMPWPEYKKLLQQYGLKVICTGADFNDLERNVPKVLAQAKELDAKYVTCTWIPHNEDTFTAYDAQRAADVFNTAGRLLKENGISLVYHLHGYEFQPYKDGTFFDYFVENFEPKYVNFEMDVFWVKHPGQDPTALIQKYPKRFPLVHLKDRKPGTPGNNTGHVDVETNVTLGQGDIGIAEFMKAARKAGVKHYFIEDESSRAQEQVPASVAFLRKQK
ncbi:sugar phosphate isomerase/epimerase family protein [Tellurirhabdus bombi]|uniref:sugar phosphate isomerase/epimerase family protein n=1 Tax=Tellurirhabdus bombi TaxID=2907205 RepID=UPI001F284DC4|nr:sugar phosphate isomerase/epimerase [Tellurirhabdus bombi]